MDTFKRLTANLQQTDRESDLTVTVSAAFNAGADIITFQECGNVHLRRLLSMRPGWAVFWPGGKDKDGRPNDGPKNSVPIAWKPDVWKFIDAGADRVVVGGTSPDAMEGVSPTRYVVWVILEHIASGEQVVHVNTHLVSGVDGVGKSPLAWRRKAHAAGVQALIARMRGFGDLPVIGSGDFNTTRLPTLVAGHGLVTEAPGNGGTFGRRVIDWYVTRDPKSRLGGQLKPQAIALGRSDHRGVMHTFEIVPSHEEPTVSQKRLTNLADVLRAGGLKVVEVDGWKTRSRPESSGGFNPVGVLCHHTATGKGVSDNAVVQLLIKGRSDLPGPLCNLGLGRDGTVYVISAGRANHAGKARASGTVAAGDGNALYVGIEAFNDGVGETWPKVQYDAYVKTCAVLSQKITGNSVNTVRGHKETSVTGKVDPRFDMDKFRAAVAAELKPAAPKPKPKPAGSPKFDLMWSTADAIARDNDYSKRKRAAAVIIRAAAAPFATKEK